MYSKFVNKNSEILTKYIDEHQMRTLLKKITPHGEQKEDGLHK
jgi:hypothetical protein